MDASANSDTRPPRTHPFLIPSLIFLAALLALPEAAADRLVTDVEQITSSAAYETTPTLGNDGTTDLVVYTSRVFNAGTLGPGDIWYQPLVAGAPSGSAVQVTSGPTDDQLNDVSGDYIVYTAYDSVVSAHGAIMVYEISTGIVHQLGEADIIQEPKIHGTRVVWREGGALSARVMYFELAWLGLGGSPLTMAGPVPPTFDVQIGSNFAVWAELDGGHYDVYAYDFAMALERRITNTPTIDERQPATSGAWIVWEQLDSGISTIEAKNMDTMEQRTIADNAADNYNPSTDGDLAAWETDVAGNLDIWVYRFSVNESYAVTTDPADQYLNDVFGDLVAYVDMTTGNEDIYVSTLQFVPDEPVTLDFDFDPAGNIVANGAIATEQWADIGVHVSCYNNVANHPDACLALASQSPPAIYPPEQPDLGTHCQGNVLIVAEDVEDFDGDGLVDGPRSEASGGQIRLTFDGPVDVASVTVFDIDTDEGGSAIMVVTDAGGGTIVVPIPVSGNGVKNEVSVDVPYAIEVTISFIHTGSLASITYTPISIPQVAGAGVQLLNGLTCDDTTWPVADAGADRNVLLGQLVQLDGSGSHDGWPADGNGPLVYEWELTAPDGSYVELTDAQTAYPAFVAEQEGAYTGTLVVTNEIGKSSYADAVQVTTTWNLYGELWIDPAAIDFGSLHPGDSLQTSLSLAYDCTGGCASLSVDPAQTLDDSIEQFSSSEVINLPADGTLVEVPITFTPTRLGDIDGQVGIRDSTGLAAIVPLHGIGVNNAPYADIKPLDPLVVLGIVQLDGSGSGDPDGDVINFAWSLIPPSGSSATLSDATAIGPTFFADVYGDYVVTLTVTDAFDSSSVPAATVTASFENLAPIADAGDNQTAVIGEDVLLSGSAFDPNQDPLTYDWSFDSKPAGSLATLVSNPNDGNASFYADVAGTYYVRLTVSDLLLEGTDTAQIQVIEVADAVAHLLSDAVDALNAMDASDFRIRQAQRFLTEKINFALDNIAKGKNDLALEILDRTVLRRIDGCALRGEPDEQSGVDTIVTCEAQAQVYPHVFEAVEFLRAQEEAP